MMQKIREFFNNARVFLGKWVPILLSDFRSALISAAFAGFGGYIGAVYANSREIISFKSVLNDHGVGYPALLFSAVKSENKEFELEFTPPALQRVAVCEYFSGRDQSFKAIMDQYLKTYSACFIPVWQNEKKLKIRPNLFTGQLKEAVGRTGDKSYWCKCSSEQISSGQVLQR